MLRTALDGSQPRYAPSNAPAELSLFTLGRIQTTRWRIECEFEMLKGEVGPDEYEVRGWRGWHHHVTLCLPADAFLMSLEQAWGGRFRIASVFEAITPWFWRMELATGVPSSHLDCLLIVREDSRRRCQPNEITLVLLQVRRYPVPVEAKGRGNGQPA